MESNTQIAERNLIAQRQDADDDEIDLLKLWQTIWYRKWGIISLVLVVTMVAVLAVLAITPIYRAAATLMIEQKGAKVVSIEQVYGLEGAGSEYLQTQFELLKSRALAERVVRQLNLTTHAEFDPRQQPEPLIDIKGLLANFDFNKVVPATMPGDLEDPEALTEAEIFDQVTRSFMERVTIAPQGKSQLVQVQVEMADAQTAAIAANALANGFIESQLEATMEMSMTATNWMNSRLGELRTKLKDSEDRLQAFREAENLVDVDGVTTISAAELSLTGDRMIDARRQRAEAESQYRQVQAMRGGGWQRLATIPAVLGHPLIQQFKTEQAKAQAKVEELSKRYGPRHPAMTAARSELSAAEGSLKGQVEQIVAGIERNYQLALANENSLRASFNANKSQIQDISRKEFQLRELQREVDGNRALYDTFMTRLKETAATADLETANARVVDPATVPTEPVKPKKTLIVAIAALLALFAGVGLTLLLDALNNTFKSTEEIENRLNIPVLGILPQMKVQERRELARMFTADTDKSFSESIRTIRTGVVLSGMDHPHKVMVITSSNPGEGKSTVSANLAFALGQMERVLLIDADLRRPTLAKSFEFPVGTPGLANLIAGTARLEECIQQVDGIDMICAGTVPPNPLELLSSPRFAKAVEVLKNKYDRIIIDSPPTQAVSDAIVLSTFADSLLYVVKSASTHIPLVEKGVGQLLQNNAPVKGIVLNQVDIKKAKRYGYSYGGYYDYYGYSNTKTA
ncbi:GumC family protein [Stutzerimonas stutzeri]|uniref:GumC family protein n=1 Tax=Stutzerimonas stutzeri TaxID=316 RepID=UPI0024B7A785|nr:polysaccharide biosynthesis tyrosine autokinase [Stutzerimonas stutzeri]MDI9728285.1 polysaccharide biosynthesis tyrosine autokinase [Stutzerimonas stutzeri]MDI9749125.1 polysaccharide biosynthesis tyrosine autokinase [Stutzerimonas stutzeri]